jgi:hypothetical protein
MIDGITAESVICLFCETLRLCGSRWQLLIPRVSW